MSSQENSSNAPVSDFPYEATEGLALSEALSNGNTTKNRSDSGCRFVYRY